MTHERENDDMQAPQKVFTGNLLDVLNYNSYYVEKIVLITKK